MLRAKTKTKLKFLLTWKSNQKTNYVFLLNRSVASERKINERETFHIILFVKDYSSSKCLDVRGKFRNECVFIWKKKKNVCIDSKILSSNPSSEPAWKFPLYIADTVRIAHLLKDPTYARKYSYQQNKCYPQRCQIVRKTAVNCNTL